MKHCPECNRNYADPTLSFCLNDGAPLIFGSAVEEPATAIRTGDPPSESPTRHIDLHTTAPTESIRFSEPPGKASRFTNKLIWLLGGLVIVATLAVYAASRFYNSANSNQIESVAVLPFENGSGDPNLDYLSDGLSESLIDKLSELPQLKVIARSSSLKYRGAGVDLGDVEKKVGARAIVTGKVARIGDNLNVRVEMVDAAENRQMRSEEYNRKAPDLISVKQEIAQTASNKLRLKLSGSQEQQLFKPGAADPQAYDLVFKGTFFANQGGTENRKRATEYFQQAVSTDPNYALAYAKLANSYSESASSSEVDQKEYLSKAESTARRALELDENLADTHMELGLLNMHAWNWTLAEAEFKRAIDLNTNLSDAHGTYAAFLSRMGRHDEAIAEATRARDLDPISLEANRIYGYRLYHARRYDEAIDYFKKMIRMDPSYDAAFGIMAYAYAAKGQYKEAIEAYQEAMRLGDHSTSVRIYLGESYAGNGEREKAKAILTDLRTTKEYVSPGELAVLYGALGDKDAAFASLNKAYDDHDLQLQFLKVDPSYDPLRDDPRFQELIRRVGLST